MSIERLPQFDLKFLGGVPVVYHCHHFNLFLDQTIDDALGASGMRLKRLAGRRAASELLPAFLKDISTPVERLEVAKELFKTMGHGNLRFNVDNEGGTASSTTLHYGLTWKEKYGEIFRIHTPVDAFACGFAAAATALAYGVDGESFDGIETECIAMRDEECRIEIAVGEPALPPAAAINPQTVTALIQECPQGLHEEEISSLTTKLNDFLAGVKPDSRGLIEAFGVYITVHLANYYNHISFDALSQIAKQDPEIVDAFADLLRESGQVCVFNTFGGILLSPEWEALVKAPKENPEEIATWCLAIARTLGFGHWSLERFILGQEMVLSTPTNYEAPYFALREQPTEKSPEFFFQGAAVAIMHLAHAVKWSESPKFTHADYIKLFEDDELPWSITQDKSAALGDSCSRITVRAHS